VPTNTIFQQEGDLVLTGTPSGVGPVIAGDKVECALVSADGQQLDSVDFDAVDRPNGYHFQSK
jgi:acylpyruvate hydrolase